MSVLMVNNNVSFTELREYLEVSDGNLASHISALEKLDYIDVTKQFKDRKPNTTYCLSPLGKMAFQRHLDALEKLLNKN
jgi:DNA-binding MarR family transcriptional regulator